MGRSTAVGWVPNVSADPLTWDSASLPYRLWVNELHGPPPLINRVLNGPTMITWANGQPGQPSQAFQCVKWLLEDGTTAGRPGFCHSADPTAGTRPVAAVPVLPQ